MSLQVEKRRATKNGLKSFLKSFKKTIDKLSNLCYYIIKQQGNGKKTRQQKNLKKF
jgi:hypothetical protein